MGTRLKKRCGVLSCRTNLILKTKRATGISYYKYPKDSVLIKKWENKCERPLKAFERFICSTHFWEQDFKVFVLKKDKGSLNVKTVKRRLKKDAVPSRNLPSSMWQPSTSSAHERLKLLPPRSISAEPTNVPYISATVKALMIEREELKRQVAEKERNSDLIRAMQKILTPNQIRLALNINKRVRWTDDEMTKAFTLRCLSIRSYVYVREKLNYPLPSLSTLRRWARNLSEEPGEIHNVINLMNRELFRSEPLNDASID